MYKQIIGRNDNIIDQACLKWNEKMPEIVEYFSLRKSFVKTTYVMFILDICTLEPFAEVFFTNNILYKMKKSLLYVTSVL